MTQSREARMFETTNMAVHKPMDYYQNTVGRKVMKTQDAVPVSINVKDEQLVVEHGTWRRLQRASDDELGQRVPKGDYTKQVPVPTGHIICKGKTSTCRPILDRIHSENHVA